MASPRPALLVLDHGHDDGRLAVSAKMTNLEELPDRVDRIEQKLTRLSDSMDRRFSEVSERFVEQRGYIEFAFEHLDRKVTAMDLKIDEVMGLSRR